MSLPLWLPLSLALSKHLFICLFFKQCPSVQFLLWNDNTYEKWLGSQGRVLNHIKLQKSYSYDSGGFTALVCCCISVVSFMMPMPLGNTLVFSLCLSPSLSISLSLFSFTLYAGVPNKNILDVLANQVSTTILFLPQYVFFFFFNWGRKYCCD